MSTPLDERETKRTDAALKGWTDLIVKESRLVPADVLANVRDLCRKFERERDAAVEALRKDHMRLSYRHASDRCSICALLAEQGRQEIRSETMTPILARLNALFEKATPGERSDHKSIHGSDYRFVQLGADDTYTTLEMLPADAELIAALHNAYPELRARIEALEAALESLADAADDVGVSHFDSDDLPPTVATMQAATQKARSALAGSAT